MSACKRSFNQVMTKKYCAAQDQDFHYFLRDCRQLQGLTGRRDGEIGLL